MMIQKNVKKYAALIFFKQFHNENQTQKSDYVISKTLMGFAGGARQR